VVLGGAGTLLVAARRNGLHLVAQGRRPVTRTAAELSALGPCVSLPADVSTRPASVRWWPPDGTREPHLDILVNNAGAAWGAPFDEFPESGWDKVVDLNLKTPFFLTQALHGALKAAGSRRAAAPR
jgi:NAD(P)-dependent dehydrogenase (short-subunit alcohol dehydrogenase family)